MFVNFKRERRLKKLKAQFPIALDVFVRGLRAGHPVASALDLLTNEMPDPIGSEFGLVVDEVTYGLDLRDALQNMADRLELPDVHMFVVSVSIQSETGGNLAEILENLAKVIRDRASMVLKVRALSSEGKMSGWMLTARSLQGRREEGLAMIDQALAMGDAALAAKARQNLAALGLASEPRSPLPTAPMAAATTRWIERTTGAIQRLVTRFAGQRVESSPIEPRFRHVQRLEEPAPRPMPTLDEAVAAVAHSDEVTIAAASERHVGRTPTTGGVNGAVRSAVNILGRGQRES